MSCSSDEEFAADMEELQSRFKANFDNAPPATFMIVSKMNGKVLDIKKCKTTPGTKIIMYDRKFDNNANQLWYIDSKGFIKSFVGQMTMFAEKEGESLKTSMTNDPRGMWRIDGEKIINGVGQHLDIRGASKYNKAELCAYKWKNQDNQKWTIQPV